MLNEIEENDPGIVFSSAFRIIFESIIYSFHQLNENKIADFSIKYSIKMLNKNDKNDPEIVFSSAFRIFESPYAHAGTPLVYILNKKHIEYSIVKLTRVSVGAWNSSWMIPIIRGIWQRDQHLFDSQYSLPLLPRESHGIYVLKLISGILFIFPCRTNVKLIGSRETSDEKKKSCRKTSLIKLIFRTTLAITNRPVNELTNRYCLKKVSMKFPLKLFS